METNAQTHVPYYYRKIPQKKQWTSVTSLSYLEQENRGWQLANIYIGLTQLEESDCTRPCYELLRVVNSANVQERAQVKELAEVVQDVTQNSVEVAFVDQGYTDDDPKSDAQEAGIELMVVKLSEAKKGFALLPRRWVVERSFAWTSRFRRQPTRYYIFSTVTHH
jgi:transposase